MEELPKPTAGDVAHTLIKAGVSGLPLIGSPIAEFFNVAIAPPLTKRRDEWFQSLAERLKLLEEKVAGFKMENLSNNEQFITSVVHATASAVRTHLSEKLEALRNAVINVALQNEADEDIQQIFLNYIDELTPSHLKVLSFFAHDPEEWFRKNRINKPDLKMRASFLTHEIAFEGLKERNMLNQLISDLRNRGLLEPKFETTEYGKISYASARMGTRFIKFISASA